MTENPQPDWTLDKNSTLVWSEDDATVSCEDHEDEGTAFFRISKVKMSPPLETWDAGDALYKLLPAGIVVISSYPGNSSIRALPPGFPVV